MSIKDPIELNRRAMLQGVAAAALSPVLAKAQSKFAVPGARAAGDFPVGHTEEEWRKLLTAEQYAVLRKSATERPFTSQLDREKRRGTFACAGCGQALFFSTTKFDSGTGWPSFWAPIADAAVGTEHDATLGIVRIAVHCNRCGGHLGHLFDDGPKPTGLRYCMNGVAMSFTPLAA